MIAVVFSLLSAASLANGAVAGRAGMQGVHPIAVIGVALVVGFIGVAIAALALSPSDLFYVPRSALLWIVVFGVVQFAVGRTSAYTGLSIIGASRVALFISTQVPFAAFFAIAFTGESLGILVAVGTVAVMLGLLLSSGDSLTTGWRTDRRYFIGCLAGLTAGAATGGSTVLAKQAVSVYDSPLTITVLGMLAAMFIVVPVVTIIASRNPAVRAFDWRSMGFIFMSGLSTTVSIVAQLFAVQRADVLIVAPILATFPLWTLLLSHIFISRLEQITLRLTIGAIVTVAGVIAVVLGGQL
jgi:DME family drug/metabolite transporter